jgi:Flp pilus assembly protein TadG
MLISRRSSKTSRRGTVTAWLVLSLAVIIAILAIGLDGGRMMEERRKAQAAADAAALAAAADLYGNYTANQGSDTSTSAQSAATTSAASNGYSNDGTNSVVTVNIPPASGTFAGQAGYVEVIIKSNLSATFGATITGSTLTVQARAVARGQPQKLGLLMLNSSMNGAFSASGFSSVIANGAGITIDSTGNPALMLSGSASLQAPAIDVSGGYTSNSRITGPVTSGVTPLVDPLKSLVPPQLSSSPVQSSWPLYVDNGSVTLQPGIYEGGIHFSGNAAVTLQPGLYILNGGTLDVSGSASLTGNGVTIHITNLWPDEVDIGGNGSVVLTPPTSGPFQGISLFQDRLNNQNIYVRGTASVQVTGLIYAPAAQVQFSGDGSMNTTGGAIIADSLSLVGSASLTVQMGFAEPAVPDCRLVE